MIGEFGYITWDEEHGSLGAHCVYCGHGLCRANKQLDRKPLGYLVAWLMSAHRDADPCVYDRAVIGRQSHKHMQVNLCSRHGHARRQFARDWLCAIPGAFKLLLDLESAHAPGAQNVEPEVVPHPPAR